MSRVERSSPVLGHRTRWIERSAGSKARAPGATPRPMRQLLDRARGCCIAAFPRAQSARRSVVGVSRSTGKPADTRTSTITTSGVPAVKLAQSQGEAAAAAEVMSTVRNPNGAGSGW